MQRETNTENGVQGSDDPSTPFSLVDLRRSKISGKKSFAASRPKNKRGGADGKRRLAPFTL